MQPKKKKKESKRNDRHFHSEWSERKKLCYGGGILRIVAPEWLYHHHIEVTFQLLRCKNIHIYRTRLAVCGLLGN